MGVPNANKKKSESMFQIEERQQKIDALNERVNQLTKKAIADSQKTGKKLSPEFAQAQSPMTLLAAGTPVYQLRSAPLVYLYFAVTSGLILWGLTKISLVAAALCAVTIFVGYDLYSGMLHVVLDHPDNIALPLFGQACLEFQWHHAIPDDLVRKDFVDVCGDLNVVVLILFFTNLALLLDVSNPSASSGIAMVIGGLKLWMAYFGQFSHKSAHIVSASKRTPVATWLQNNGFMISHKAHMSHHKPPHDVDFCLIGLCNPVIAAMRAVTINNAVWLSVFLVWSLFDVWAYVKCIEHLTGAIGA